MRTSSATALSAVRDYRDLYDRGQVDAKQARFVVLQEFVEPNVKHVKQVNAQKQKSGQNGPHNDIVE